MEVTPRYGVMRDIEYELMDRTVDRIKLEFGAVSFLEIGVYGGGTLRRVYKRCEMVGCSVSATGVDVLEHYKPDTEMDNYTFITGDSMDAFRQIKGKFNLLLIDGCHCVNHSMCDFLNYSPFIVVGGYCVCHDTALPDGKLEQGTWPQNHSYAGQPPSVLGVRNGLKKLGLLQGYRLDWRFIEEVPNNVGLSGAMLFQKMFEL